MAISTDEVAALAALARISLTAEEVEDLVPQLDRILVAVAQVSDVATGEVPAMSHPLALTNVFRPDVVVPCLPAADVLSQAPAVEQGRFQVPRILDSGQPRQRRIAADRLR